jgi:hypothetical protein
MDFRRCNCKRQTQGAAGLDVEGLGMREVTTGDASGLKP